VLGPLTNPAGASHQLIGVGHPDIALKLARVLEVLGSRHAVLVHAEEGLDELGLAGSSTVTEFDARTGRIQQFTITPEEFGLERASVEHLSGGSAADNVTITRSILSGEPGPRRSVTLLNAGAGIYAADAAESFAEGIRFAEEIVDSGKALAKIDELAAFTTDLVSAREPALVTV
jgi:anthranilate phosphoribosyltransferase